MKKIIACLIALFVSLCTFGVMAASMENNPFDIFVNNIKVDSGKTFIFNDSIYIPLRKFANIMRWTVQWDESNKTVKLSQYKYPNYTSVNVDGKYGFLDDSGNIVIEPKYDNAYDFSEGLALVYQKDKGYSYINLNGEVVITGIYPQSHRFKEGVATVTDYYMGLPDEAENTSGTDVDYRMYYIDKCGNMLFGKYFARAGEFNDGFAYVQIEGYVVPTPNVKDVYTYIDTSGNYATDMRFDNADDFKDGYAEVTLNGVKGTIDTSFNFTPTQ